MIERGDAKAMCSLSRISRLPWVIREQLNERLRDNRKLSAVATWLFEQQAADDLPELGILKGDPYSKLYAGSKDPLDACCKVLSKYRYSPTHRLWLEDEKRRGLVGAMIANLDAAAAAGRDSRDNTDGVSTIAVSVILGLLEKLAAEETPSVAEITSLSRAIASLNSGLTASRRAELDQRRLALVEKKAATEDAAANKPQLTPEEKEQRYKEIFGIE